MPVITVFCSENLFLCQGVPGCAPFSFLSNLLYMVLCWHLWSVWSLGVFFFQDDKYGSIWTVRHAATQFNKNHLLAMLYFCSVYISSLIIKNQLSIAMCIYGSVFNLILSISMSVFVPIWCCFYYYNFIVWLEIVLVRTSAFLLIFSIILAILFLFVCFHIKLKIVLSRTVKNCVRIIMGVALNL